MALALSVKPANLRCGQPDPKQALGMSETELLSVLDDAAPDASLPKDEVFVASAQLIQLYLQQCPLRIRELRSALATGDWPLLARAGHTLKGNSCYVSADAVGQLGGVIEQRVEEGSLADIADLIDQLEDEFNAAKTALLSRLEEAV